MYLCTKKTGGRCINSSAFLVSNQLRIKASQAAVILFGCKDTINKKQFMIQKALILP